MAKNKKGKFNSGTFIEREVYLSRAFLELGGFAPQLLVLFLGKRDRDKRTKEFKNLNALEMTYAELENIHHRGMIGHDLPKDGISRPRIIRALDDLLAKGFIKIVRRGGAWKQDKSVYALTDEWRYWKPGIVVSAREKDTRERGYLNKVKFEVSRTETLPIHTHENVTHTPQ